VTLSQLGQIAAPPEAAALRRALGISRQASVTPP
jgi:hypothetical protein